MTHGSVRRARFAGGPPRLSEPAAFLEVKRPAWREPRTAFPNTPVASGQPWSSATASPSHVGPCVGTAAQLGTAIAAVPGGCP